MIRYVFPMDILIFGIQVKQNFTFLSVSDTIEFADTMGQTEGEGQIIGVSVSDSLSITDSMSPKFGIVQQILNLGHGVIVKNPIQRTIIDRLSFGERVARAKREDVYQNLFLQQFVNVPQHHKLVLMDVAQVDQCRFTKSVLGLTHNVLAGLVDRQDVSDELALSDSATVINDGRSSCLFSAITLPTLTKRDHITLSNGSTTLTLRNPEFGDKDTNQQLRVQRKSLGGDLIVHRQPNWPKIETLTYTINLMKQSDADVLKQFIQTNNGKSLTLVDHYTRTWTGVILTPTNEYTQENRFTWTISFTFEGVMS